MRIRSSAGFFLTLLKSLEMIFSQYTETCEVIIDYQKIVGYYIEVYAKIPLGIFSMQILIYTAED